MKTILCKCRGVGCGCCFGSGKLAVIEDLTELHGDPEYVDDSGVIEWWAREVNGE